MRERSGMSPERSVRDEAFGVRLSDIVPDLQRCQGIADDSVR